MRKLLIISFKSLACIFLAATLFNCTPTYKAHRTYPNFYKQYNEFDSVKLAVDATVFENRRNRPLDYDRQILVAKEFHKEFVKRVGIDFKVDIDTTFYGSLGLYLYEGSAAYIVDALNDEGEVIDSTMIIGAPFFLSQSLGSDFLFKEELLLTAVDTLAWDVEVEEPYFPNDIVFICKIDGVNTRFVKQLGQVLVTGLATLGNAYAYQTSYLEGTLYIFDRETGKLIWLDKQYYQSDHANGLAARHLARKFVERFSRVNSRRP